MLARSVAEDLVTELARGPDLRVVSHQSSFRFASNVTPPAEIGRRLRSRYLVDGRVRREGEQLRIVVELLDSEEGHVVWSSAQRVDRETLQAAREALVSRMQALCKRRFATPRSTAHCSGRREPSTSLS
jgi:adenylate cyclase